MSIPKRLHVLVTGATGFLGSHTAKTLLGRGHQVTALVRNPEKADRVFGGADYASLRIARGDITDRSSIEAAAEDCDGVVHCAAVISVDAARAPGELLETNVEGAKNVIGTAVDRGLERIVHVSSIAPLFRSDGTPVTESSEPQSSNHAYAQSKMLAEIYVRGLQSRGLPVQVLYPGAIIGPDDPALTESMNSLAIFMNVALPITTGGFQFVDVRDLAHAIACMMEDEPGSRRYLAPGAFVSWPELARMLEHATGRRPPKMPAPAMALRMAGRVTDFLRRFVSIELPLSEESANYITRWTPIESSSDFARLGVTFRGLEESLGDAVDWLATEGHL